MFSNCNITLTNMTIKLFIHSFNEKLNGALTTSGKFEVTPDTIINLRFE